MIKCFFYFTFLFILGCGTQRSLENPPTPNSSPPEDQNRETIESEIIEVMGFITPTL